MPLKNKKENDLGRFQPLDKSSLRDFKTIRADLAEPVVVRASSKPRLLFYNSFTIVLPRSDNSGDASGDNEFE